MKNPKQAELQQEEPSDHIPKTEKSSFGMLYVVIEVLIILVFMGLLSSENQQGALGGLAVFYVFLFYCYARIPVTLLCLIAYSIGWRNENASLKNQAGAALLFNIFGGGMLWLLVTSLP